MIGDFAIDRLIKRDNGKLGFIFPIVSTIALVIFIIFFNMIPILLGINVIYLTGMISFGLSYLVYRLNKNLNIDFEMEIINDEFSCTKITNSKKRNLLFDFSIRDCDFIGPVTSDRFEEDREKALYLLNITTYKNFKTDDTIWYALVNGNGSKYIVVFEFEPCFYSNFKRYNPRNVAQYTVPVDLADSESSEDDE